MDEKTTPADYWEERGWQKTTLLERNQTIYQGKYHVNDADGKERLFDGYVSVVHELPFNIGDEIITAPDRFAVFINDPPVEIKKHSKGPCFMLRSEYGKTPALFSLNFTKPPTHVDQAIL